MEPPQISVGEFFTLASLATLAGASGATWVVANTLWLVFRAPPLLVGFFTAQAICHGLVALSGAPLFAYAIAFINACLVFMTALGGASLAAPPDALARTTRTAGGPRRFRVRWI